jgi:membrane protease YdiL (CAAX protease family)
MPTKIENPYSKYFVSKNIIINRFAILLFACCLALSYIFSVSLYTESDTDFKYHWGARIFLPISLAFVVMRGWLPKTAFSKQHLTPISIGLFCLSVQLLFMARTDFEEMYRSIYISGLTGLWCCICIYLLSRTTSVPNTEDYNNSLLWGLLTTILVITGFSQHLSYDIHADALISSMSISLLTNIVFIGLSEELAFRGVIQGVLEQHWRGNIGIFSHANIITAILFSLIHNTTFNPEIFPWYLMLFPMGLFFGLLRDKTGSWLAPGIVHASIIPIYTLSKSIDCKFVASCIAAH